MSGNGRNFTGRLERLESVSEEVFLENWNTRRKWDEFTSQFTIEELVSILRGTAPPDLEMRSERIVELKPPHEVQLIIDEINQEVERVGLEVVVERFLTEYGEG